jgi:hypothetical protein
MKTKVTVEVKIDLGDIENDPIFNEALSRLKSIKSGKSDYLKKFGSEKTNINKSYIAYNNFRDEFAKIDND